MKRGMKVELDPVEVEKLAKLGATLEEMADFFQCCSKTLSEKYSESVAKGRASMKLRLRQLQWQSAENGNISMQIWLGKQVLGQSDKQESKVEGRLSVEDLVVGADNKK